MPALPLHEAGKYVAAAYVVFVALILIYVAIMAIRLGRMERDLIELHELADGAARRGAMETDEPSDDPDPADRHIAGASR